MVAAVRCCALLFPSPIPLFSLPPCSSSSSSPLLPAAIPASLVGAETAAAGTKAVTATALSLLSPSLPPRSAISLSQLETGDASAGNRPYTPEFAAAVAPAPGQISLRLARSSLLTISLPRFATDAVRSPTTPYASEQRAEFCRRPALLARPCPFHLSRSALPPSPPPLCSPSLSLSKARQAGPAKG